MADVQQTEKMVPFITFEVPFSQHVSELFFGVNIFDLNLRIQINSFKEPVLSNSVGSGYVSHCRTSAVLMIILITASLSSKNEEHRTELRRLCVR